jgi:hypothetical protein
MVTRMKKVALGLILSAAGVAYVLWPSPDWVPVPIQGLEAECFQEETPVPWSFCINRTAQSNNRDIIYYFHGRNGAATWWNDQTYYTGEVQQFWADAGIAAPTVVGVSFGRLWLFTGGDAGVLPIFTNHVIRRVEAQLNQPVNRRLAVGESMGGLNALVLGFKSNGLFQKVAALCPPLPPLSPSSSLSEGLAYVHRSSTSWQRAAMLRWFANSFYPTETDWREGHPVPLSAQPMTTLQPEFYLSCGLKDDWGCFEGGKLIVNNLRQKNVAIEWKVEAGGHCDVNAASLARFLVDK